MSNPLKLLLALMASLMMAPAVMAQSAYKISPGDVLQLDVLEDPSLNRTLLVLPDGSITVPQGGTIRAAGNSVAAVQAAVTQALAPNFATAPTVTVAVGQLAPRVPASTAPAPVAIVSVYALGEVANPGRIDVTPRHDPVAVSGPERRHDQLCRHQAYSTAAHQFLGPGADLSVQLPGRDGWGPQPLSWSCKRAMSLSYRSASCLSEGFMQADVMAAKRWGIGAVSSLALCLGIVGIGGSAVLAQAADEAAPRLTFDLSSSLTHDDNPGSQPGRVCRRDKARQPPWPDAEHCHPQHSTVVFLAGAGPRVFGSGAEPARPFG